MTRQVLDCDISICLVNPRSFQDAIEFIAEAFDLNGYTLSIESPLTPTQTPRIIGPVTMEKFLGAIARFARRR